MRHFLPLIALLLLLTGCKKELVFTEKAYEKKTTLPCKKDCAHITVKIPEASGVPIVADSINKTIFTVLKGIVYFGEKPYNSVNYDDLLASFIHSYEKMQKDFPDDIIGWEGDIEGRVRYQSDSILNIEIKHYTFTGGAHGYSGLRSLIFNPETGKTIANKDLFNDVNAFMKFAEAKFRTHFKIPENAPINSGGFMFENEVFALPQTIFFTDKGLLLYYNAYEIASYADGPQELLIPYNELKPYLKIR